MPGSNELLCRRAARDTAIADQLGRLLMAARDLADDIQRPSFAGIMLNLRRLGLTVSAAELRIRMGVSKGTISDLMKERSDAGVDLLLRLHDNTRGREGRRQHRVGLSILPEQGLNLVQTAKR